MAASRIPISVFSIALAACTLLVHTSSAFWWTNCQKAPVNLRTKGFRSLTNTRVSAKNHGDTDDVSVQRREATIRLKKSGKEAILVSRTLPVFRDGTSVTVWELKNPSANDVNAYWDAQGQTMATANQKPILDPFGLVSWSGSVIAARELYTHAKRAVSNQTVVVLGARVGVETQAAAMLGAKQVIATDIHPTTLQQLEYGVAQNYQIPSNIVTTQVLDLFLTRKQPIPSCDVLVFADVLYSEQLASQVCRRCAEALKANPKIKIFITDSQRIVEESTFIDELMDSLTKFPRWLSHPPPTVQWKTETMKDFERWVGIIDEDQTHDVKVRCIWIGL